MRLIIARISHRKYSKNEKKKLLISIIVDKSKSFPVPVYFNVVQVQFDEFRVVVLYSLYGLLDVCVIWRILRVDFLCLMFGDAIPAEADRLTFVQQRCVILILIHHRVETKNSYKTNGTILVSRQDHEAG